MATNNYPNLTRAAGRLGIVALLFIIIMVLAGGCMTSSIDSGEAGVKYSMFGGTELHSTYGEGMKFHAPWVKVIRYDIRINEKLESMEVLSSNGLSIGTDVSIRWRPDASELPQLHTTYGTDYYRKLIQPELRSATREVVGQYTPDELYSSKRTELQEKIFEQVKRGVEGRYVKIEAILIRDVRLPDQIKTAIENKLKEEQDAERYEFTLRKEKLEAQRKKIEADGQAQYQHIITQSLTQQFLKFKGIEATEKLANSPNAKTVIIGAGDTGLPIILGGQ